MPRLASEGPVLYSIWKIRHGYPLYEPPFAPPFAVTLYNFLSYKIYAAALGLFAVPDRLTPLAARAVTAAFAMLAAVLQYATARTLMGANRARLLAALLAVVTWIGAALPGWWILAIRPDVGAVALDLAGVLLVLRSLSHMGSRSDPTAAALLGAGLLFLAAWAFKQSHVLVAGTTVAYLALGRRSSRDAALVATPFVTGVTLALVIGGPVYRANIITAPALSPSVPLYAWFGLRTLALPDALFWISLAIALPLVARQRGERPALAYVFVLAVVTGAGALAMLAKAGSAINHAIEFKACAALVAAGVLGAATPRTRWTDRFAIAAVAVMIASHVSRLAADRDLLLGSDADRSAQSRRATAALVAELPRPVYAEDELYALPWIANGNAYPAVIPDYQVYHSAKDAGVLGDTIEAMIGRGAFAALALQDTSPLIPLAAAAGYETVRTVPQLRDRPVTILRRPNATGTR